MLLVVAVSVGSAATVEATNGVGHLPSGDQVDGGDTVSGTLSYDIGTYPYLLHTPASVRGAGPAPLVVVLHGCQTTAEQQMRASLFNQVAERERFVVLYPDVDEVGQLLPGPANQCWKFPYPPAWVRGGSDAGAIAAMTRLAMDVGNIDPERVYLVGMSAGGLMTAIEAAAYPDLYAAVGIIAAGGYLDSPCLGTGLGIPVELSAQLAHLAMGERARVVPRFVMGGTADTAFPPACVIKALQQGLRTTNLVLSGQQTAPIDLHPATVTQGQVPDGHTYTVSSFLDPDGCLVGEQWIIDDLIHSWPGGTSNPEDRYNNDTRAPSAAEVSWSFFERYRLSDTAMPCATTEHAGRPPAPPARAVDSAPLTPSTTVAAADTPRPAVGTLPSTGTATSSLALVLAAAGLAIGKVIRRHPG